MNILGKRGEKFRKHKYSINLRQFIDKSFNSFWEYDEETKKFIEISSSVFNKEEISMP